MIYLRIREIILVKSICFLIDDWVKSFMQDLRGSRWREDWAVDWLDKEVTVSVRI